MTRIEPELKFEERNYRYSNGSLYPAIALVSSITALLVVGGIVYVLSLVRQHLIIVGYIWLTLLGAIPILGLAWGILAVVHKYRQVQVIDIGGKGTIIRLPSGKLQIVSSEELYAMESTKEEQYIDASPVYTPLPEQIAFPLVSPAEAPIEAVSDVEIDAETVMETLRIEQEQAKNELANKQREVMKQRIASLHAMGLSLRSISQLVHLQGRRYNEFKELCAELNINTE